LKLEKDLGAHVLEGQSEIEKQRAVNLPVAGPLWMLGITIKIYFPKLTHRSINLSEKQSFVH